MLSTATNGMQMLALALASLPLLAQASALLSVKRQEVLGYNAPPWDSKSCLGSNGRTAYLTISLCNRCSGGSGGPSCSQTNYASNTDTPENFGTGGCNRDPSFDSDFDGCDSIDHYSISTPMGYGKYIANPGGNCDPGQVAGTIVTESGYTMTCQRLGDSEDTTYSKQCGLFPDICTAFVQCTGVQNPDVCP